MSRTVDERVVEMQFNNRDFEKNVKESMSTLDKLKSKLKLKDAADGLKELENAGKHFDMSSIGKSVDYIANQFNLLGRVGMKLKNDIASYVASIIENFASLPKKLSLDQIGAGWEKYGEKASSVQTIMAATGKSVDEVEEQMRKLMWFTDETSYSFTDMSANIGKFTNAGVDLETATTAMMGISNWAARSGANVNEAGRAMYNLSQALAVGQVKLMDWKSVENANMATVEFKKTAIDTAVALGTLKEVGDGVYKTLRGTTVSATNFNEALSEGWFNSDVLLKTLNLYGEYTEAVYANREAGELAADTMERIGDMGMTLGAEAFKAAQEYRTAADVVNATTDAVSTKWMGIFQLFFGNAEEAKRVWAELGGAMYDIFAGPLDSLTELLEPAFLDPVDQLKQALSEAGVDYDHFYESLLSVMKARGEVRAYAAYGGGADAFGVREFATRIDVIRALNKEMYDTTESVETLENTMEDLSGIVDEVIVGKWGNGAERVRRLTEANYDAAFVQKLVNKELGYAELATLDLTDAQFKELGYTEEQLDKIHKLREELFDVNNALYHTTERLGKKGGTELLFESIQNIIEAGYKLAEVIGGAFRDIFPATTSEQIYNLIEAFHAFTERLIMSEETMEKVRRVLRGFFAAIDIVWQAIKAVAGGIKDIIKAILPEKSSVSGFLDFAGGISDVIVGFDKMLKETGAIKNFISTGVGYITKGIEKVKEFISRVPELVGTLIAGFRKDHPKWVEAWDSFKLKVSDFVRNFGANLTTAYNKFKGWLGKMKNTEKGAGLFDTLKAAAGKAGEWLGAAWDKIKEVWGLVWPNIKGLFSDLGSGIADSWEAIKDAIARNDLGDLGEALEGIANVGAFAVIFKFIKSLKKLKGSWEGILGGLEKATKKLPKLVNAFSNRTNAEALKAVAISLGILAGSLWVLSKIPADDLDRSVGAIMKLATALGILSLVMSKYSFTSKNGASFSKEGGGGILDSFKNAIGGDKKSTASMVKLALGVLVLAKAVQLLAAIPEDQLTRGLAAILGLMTGMTVMIAAIPSDRNVKQLGKTFKSLGKSMIMVAAAFKIMQTIPFESLAASTAVMIIVLVGVTKALASIKENKVSPGLIQMFSDAIIKLGGGLALLAVGAYVASKIGWAGLAVALTLFAGALVVLIGAAAIVDKANLGDSLDKIGAAFLKIGIGTALAGLGLVLVAKGLIALAAASVVAEAAAGTLVIALGAVLTGILLWAKDNIPLAADVFVEFVTSSIRALSESATEIAKYLTDAILEITDYMLEDDRWSTMVDRLLTMVVQLIEGLADHMPELLAAATKVINSLLHGVVELIESKVTPEKFILIMMSTEVMILMLKQLAEVKSDALKALLSVGVMLLMFGGVAGIFYLIRDIDGGNMLAQALAIDSVLGVIAGIVTVLKDINPAQAATAALDLGTFIGTLTGSLVAIGGIVEGIDALIGLIPGASDTAVEDMIDKAFGVLVQISEGFGEVIGAFGGGIAAGTIDPFLETISKFDETTVQGASMMAEALLNITKAELIDGISSLLTKGENFSGLGKKLVDLGKAMKKYVKVTKGITEEDVKGPIAAGKIFAELANCMPRENGLLQALIGETINPKILGKQLLYFGHYMVKFAEKTEGLSTDMIEPAVNAGKLLCELSDQMPKEDGLLQWLTGETMDMSEFGAELVDFGQAMVDYADKVKDLDTLAIRKSATAIQSLLDLINAYDWTNIDVSLGSVGGQLSALSEGLNAYYVVIDNFDNTKLENAATHLDSIVGTLTSVGATTYIQDLLTTLTTLSEFDVQAMIDIFEGAPEKMYQAGKDSISEFVRGVGEGGNTDVAAGLETFSASLTFVKTIQDEIAKYTDGLFTTGQNLFGNFVDGIRSTNTSLSNTVKHMFRTGGGQEEGILDYIEGLYSTFETDGKSIVDNLKNGVADTEKANILWNTATALVDGISSKLTNEDSIKKYKDIGKNIVQGIADGIDNATHIATEAMDRLSQAMINTTTSPENLDEHSPSKKFKKIGVYVVKGFAQGIEISEKLIKKTVTKTFGKRLMSIAEAMVSNFGGTLDSAKEQLRETFTKLYKETDAYKESVKTIKGYRKEIRKLEEEKASLTDTNEIENIDKQIEEKNKQIIEEEKKMIQDMEDLVNEFYTSIVDNINGALDIFNLQPTFDLDLFGAVDSFKDASNSASGFLQIEADIQDETSKLGDSLNVLNATMKETETVTEAASEKLNKHADILSSAASETKEDSDSISSSLKVVDKALDSTIDTFAAFKKNERLGAKTILNRMESQITGLVNWYSDLDELAGTGISTALFDKLKSMGPEGANYVDAFLRMTEEQLEQANVVFDQQARVSTALYLNGMLDEFQGVKDWAANLQTLVERGLNQGLLQELADLGPSGAEKVKAFVSMTEDEFKRLNDIYAESIQATADVTKSIGDITTKYAKESAKAQAAAERKALLDSMKETVKATNQWTANMKKLTERGLEEGLLKQLAELGPSGADKVQMFVDMTDKELQELNDVFKKSIKATKKAEEEIKSLTEEEEKEVTKSEAQLWIEAMKEQNDGVDKWSKNLKKLMKRGLNEGLIKELADAGPSSADKVNQLVKMTSEELKGVNEQYARSFVISETVQKRITKLTKSYTEKVAEEQAKAQAEAERKSVLDQMNQQNKNLNEWASNLKKLAKRGLEEGLLKELAELGSDGSEKVKMFVSMTDSEFKKLNKYYRQSKTVAADVNAEVAKLTSSYDAKTAKTSILASMRAQLDAVYDYNKDVKKLRKKGLDEGLLAEVEALGQEGADKVKAFLQMSTEEIKAANSMYKEKVSLSTADLTRQMRDQMKSVSQWADNINKLTNRGASKSLIRALIEKGPESAEYVETLLNMTAKEFKSFNKMYKRTDDLAETVAAETIAAYTQAGKKAANGFAQGIKNGIQNVKNAAGEMANAGLEAVRRTLDIHSPSREMGKLGRFAGLGFADALRGMAEQTYEAGAEVGEESILGLISAIAQITDILDTDMDLTPVITPVVNMDEVNKGIQRVNTGFNSIYGLDVAVDTKQARRISSQFDSIKTGDVEEGAKGNTSYTFNQYNTSPKALSRLDIYRQTQNQFAAFERR